MRTAVLLVKQACASARGWRRRGRSLYCDRRDGRWRGRAGLGSCLRRAGEHEHADRRRNAAGDAHQVAADGTVEPAESEAQPDAEAVQQRGCADEAEAVEQAGGALRRLETVRITVEDREE